MNIRFSLSILFFSLVLMVNAQSPTPSFISDSLDNYINTGMADWHIPGLAIAIIKDGKTIVMRGYGVKDLTTKEPVDENTLFQIASNSKLFTGTALAQLDYNKKLSIDDKVSKYIKDYSLYDKNSTDLVTIRDLLSHRIGTKTFQADFVFWNSNLSREGIMKRMKLMKPVAQFRQHYGYCNSCFMTAGEVIPIVSGKPWEVYVYDSILMPLQMNNTYTLSQGINQRANVAKPYTNSYTGNLTELPFDNIDNIGAAASIVSNVKDISHWLQMQLDSGRYMGKQVMPWEVLEKTRVINNITRSSRHPYLPLHIQGYGLGVFTADYLGRQIYFHTGGADGFVTNTCFVPEENLAITILTNNDNQNFFEALRYQVLDAYLGTSYRNHSKNFLPAFEKGQSETIKATKAFRARVTGKSSNYSLDTYPGTYENEIYGEIEIEKNKEGKGLQINFPGHNNLTATLQYMDSEEWLLTYNNLSYGLFPVHFKMNNKKAISIDIKVNDFIDYDTYTFLKKG